MTHDANPNSVPVLNVNPLPESRMTVTRFNGKTFIDAAWFLEDIPKLQNRVAESAAEKTNQGDSP